MRFFNSDTPGGRFLAWLGDMMLLNLCFLLGSLPLISIGGSLTAMYGIWRGERNETSIVRDFFQLWKENFRVSTYFWLGQTAATGMLGWMLMLALNQFPQSTILCGCLIWSAVLGILAVTGICFTIYPQIAGFENSCRNYLKNSVILMLIKGGWIVLGVGLLSIPGLLAVFMPGLFLKLGFLWPLFGFSGIFWLEDKLMKVILRPLLGS